VTAEAALSGVMALVDLRMGRAVNSPAATRHRREAIERVCVSVDQMRLFQCTSESTVERCCC